MAHLWRAARSVERFARDDIASLGMSITDFAIMEALYHKGELTAGEIGEKALLTSGAITTAVDRLVDAGLVARKESTGDRRVRNVALTASGKRAIAAAFTKHAARLEELFAPVTAAERTTFTTLAVRIGALADDAVQPERKRS